MNIYVGNLPKNTNSDSLRQAFEVYGEVSSVNLIKDRYTQELRGFAFVEMPAKKEGQDAIENLNGGEIDGRNIVVSEAKPRKEFNNNRGFANKRQW